MILNCICSRIKSIFLTFLGLFKRALCIINRRRPSDSHFEPLETISIVRTNNYSNTKEKDWNTWDDTPRTVEEHIEKYREKLAKPPTPTEVAQEPDFFAMEGLVPKIIKQEKILIATNDNETPQNNNFSRLQATADIAVNSELKDWEELEQQGWEEADDESTKQMIREKRKELRHQQRQQQQGAYGGRR
ncbi:uncharacterized protein LOC134826901 [Culicoides brevitarsis]|uniref:uncharacterized protein LOC134826901 n=1 Tax=Culicoides brevitarsis TaxID=469753 RepID=UPI00307BF10B